MAPSRPIGRVKYFDKILWVANILESLDEPGEWVSSAVERKISFWPRGEGPGDGIVAPALSELVRVEGKIDYDEPGDRLKGTHTDHNLYWCPADPAWGQRYLDGQRLLGVENESLCADPRFVDIEKGDLRLKPKSPAWQLGFQQIDLADVGLLPNHPYDQRVDPKAERLR